MFLSISYAYGSQQIEDDTIIYVYGGSGGVLTETTTPATPSTTIAGKGIKTFSNRFHHNRCMLIAR